MGVDGLTEVNWGSDKILALPSRLLVDSTENEMTPVEAEPYFKLTIGPKGRMHAPLLHGMIPTRLGGGGASFHPSHLGAAIRLECPVVIYCIAYHVL